MPSSPDLVISDRRPSGATPASCSDLRFEAFWPTPVLKLKLARDEAVPLNAALARIILDNEADILAGRATPVAGLNEGITTHWQEYNVLKFPEPEAGRFADIVVDALRSYLTRVGEGHNAADLEIVGISCWANILRFGEGLQFHHHDPAFVVGHYVVENGFDPNEDRPSESGHTVYIRPGFMDRPQEGLWDDGWRRSEEPSPGSLTLFPGYVRHEVRPYLGQTQRITIAFDCYIRGQKPLIYFGGPRWYVPPRG